MLAGILAGIRFEQIPAIHVDDAPVLDLLSIFAHPSYRWPPGRLRCHVKISFSEYDLIGYNAFDYFNASRSSLWEHGTYLPK